jgi:hypothetical protein
MLVAGLSLIALSSLVALIALTAFVDECHPSWYLDDDGQDASTSPR